ncbi:MAG: ferredoxin--NADP reductase [Cytophagaceae bacterium]|nr:ferredoxin--NADP reductase [Cytophagaceae bacterium]MDW8456069.1 ferredoxin--NADP reductase [Cytophagaceae bacterium]
MNSTIHSLKVKDIITETPEAKTIIFHNPDPLKPYESGQFLTLTITIDGQSYKRSYSLCSAYGIDQDWAVTVKKIPGGKVSSFLVDHLKAGDVIESTSPMGVFTYNAVPPSTPVILIAGGSGITPLFSILKRALCESEQTPLLLIYANKDENSVIFKNKLNEYSILYKHRLQIIHCYSQPINSQYPHQGRLTKDKIIRLIKQSIIQNPSNALAYVCGPTGLMAEAIQALKELNLNIENIKKENFSSAAASTQTQTQSAEQNGFTVTVLYKKNEYKIFVPPNKTILEAALDNSIDLPYSCQSGMCTACMGKCTSGSVHMHEPEGLSEKEIKQGYVLTCVGKPTTPDVIIDLN